MANNWEDVAQYLLRNRSIREMVDEVIKSFEETDWDTSYHTTKRGELPCCSPDTKSKCPESKSKKDKNVTKTKRLSIRQRQQLQTQYSHKKDVTQESENEFNSSAILVKKWFNNRQKRETHRIKRNGKKRNRKTYTSRQNSAIHLNYFIQPLKMNSMKNRNISLYSNAQDNVSKQNYQNIRGFFVTQDENGICVLHE